MRLLSTHPISFAVMEVTTFLFCLVPRTAFSFCPNYQIVRQQKRGKSVTPLREEEDGIRKKCKGS